jgi:hypothetical protein
VLPDVGSGGSSEKRLPPSFRPQESGVGQGLYRLEMEVVVVLRGEREESQEALV